MKFNFNCRNTDLSKSANQIILVKLLSN